MPDTNATIVHTAVEADVRVIAFSLGRVSVSLWLEAARVSHSDVAAEYIAAKQLVASLLDTHFVADDVSFYNASQFAETVIEALEARMPHVSAAEVTVHLLYSTGVPLGTVGRRRAWRTISTTLHTPA